MTSARVGTSHATLAGRAMSRPVGGVWTQIAEGLIDWVERARQRRHLAELSAHMLKDIGLSRADVETEVAKPFWRP